MDARYLIKCGLVAISIVIAMPALARDSEIVTGNDQSSPPSNSDTLTSTCKIKNNMPQAGCTDEDLCLFNARVYAHACKQVEDARAKRKALADEEAAIHSALRNTDPLFSVEDDCSADKKVIGKGAAIASVVPFKTKKQETLDPSAPGWNVPGMGAREADVTRCRFWFKKR